MGQSKSKNTEIFNYETKLVEFLKPYPLKKTDPPEGEIKTPILNIYASLTDFYIFLYKGETMWNLSYSDTGSGSTCIGRDIEMTREERVEYIFVNTMKFFEEFDIEKIKIEDLQYFIKGVELFRRIIWEFGKSKERQQRLEKYESLVSALNEKIKERCGLEKEK